jgi:hypothetical protein
LGTFSFLRSYTYKRFDAHTRDAESIHVTLDILSANARMQPEVKAINVEFPVVCAMEIRLTIIA